MVDASVTKWMAILDTPNVGFIGGGASVGSLYYEPFLRGARRLPVSEHLRVSVMGRYGRPWPSAAFGAVSSQSLLGQSSIAVGRYAADNSPLVEVEVSFTYDSGLFRSFDGVPREQFFLSLAFRKGPFTAEVWNDSWHPAHLGTIDFGPTYGFMLQLDLLRL